MKARSPNNRRPDLIFVLIVFFGAVVVFVSVSGTIAQTDNLNKPSTIKNDCLLQIIISSKSKAVPTRQDSIEVRIANGGKDPVDLSPERMSLFFSLYLNAPLIADNRKTDVLGRISIPPVNKDAFGQKKWELGSAQSVSFSVPVSSINWLDGRSSYLTCYADKPVIFGRYFMSVSISGGRSNPVVYDPNLLKNVRNMTAYEIESNALLIDF